MLIKNLILNQKYIVAKTWVYLHTVLLYGKLWFSNTNSVCVILVSQTRYDVDVCHNWISTYLPKLPIITHSKAHLTILSTHSFPQWWPLDIIWEEERQYQCQSQHPSDNTWVIIYRHVYWKLSKCFYKYKLCHKWFYWCKFYLLIF